MSNKKLAKLLLVIFMVEFLAINLIDSLYYGVINTLLFGVGIILQLLCFVFIQEVGKGKWFLVNIGLLVLIPLLFIFNLPSTTYEGGKVIVQNEIINDEVTFVSTDYKLIQTTDNSSWFIGDFMYHYEVEVSGEKLFYVVNPTNGSSRQLEEDFFRYDR
ncbi:hypothetical protein GH741_12700 [Aquibacillus halophilus]|uniref:Uncharacterized protein n=1 Tax=Aquibacillus halophilus TaxID=930132 RepID=A0A6A8DIB9_9BACI|nr:hypothetical protein [Aquibacillus halophilus]MRH43539.1 hypothetical protein [Aquibacillus halophilus]